MAKRSPPVMPRARRQIESLGERLRAARMRRQHTQHELALRVGVGVKTIMKIEAGDPSVSMSTMLRVLSALGLDKDIDTLASEDALGRELQDSRLRRTNPSGTDK